MLTPTRSTTLSRHPALFGNTALYRGRLIYITFVRLGRRENTNKKHPHPAITVILVILAFIAIFRAWVYYTESPWTRDARFSADVVAIALTFPA
ncbi:hypothetical protein ACNKHQ_18915 [Shigella flexneri]